MLKTHAHCDLAAWSSRATASEPPDRIQTVSLQISEDLMAEKNPFVCLEDM